MSINRVVLIGNLTRDPELSQTNSGISVCKFNLAVQRKFQNSDGDREADFFTIIVWREQGENCHKYLSKGKKAGVVGRLQTRSYDAQDGTKRYVTEIIADEVEFLSPKSEDRGEPAPERKPARTAAELEPVEDDDLPF